MSRQFHPGMGQAVAERTILRKIPVAVKDTYVISPEDPNHDHLRLFCDTNDIQLEISKMAPAVEVRWETWGEVAARVAEGNLSLVEGGEDEKKQLADHIANAAILMSGRHLQHGDAKQHTRNMEVFTNCLGGDTQITTMQYGVKSLKELSGQEVDIQAKDGTIRPAKINSFGVRSVKEYVFKQLRGSNHLLQRVTATPDHRWFLRDGSVTESLSVGDQLLELDADVAEDSQGKIHGLVFGDGTAHKRRRDYSRNFASQGRTYATIRVCDRGEYQQQIHDLLDSEKYSYSTPDHAKGDRVYYVGKFPHIKDLPTTNDPEYISGFI